MNSINDDFDCIGGEGWYNVRLIVSYSLIATPLSELFGRCAKNPLYRQFSSCGSFPQGRFYSFGERSEYSII